MRILHLWDTYAPNLFDHSHSLCLAMGLESDIVCMAITGDPKAVPINVQAVSRLEQRSRALSISRRLFRRLRRFIDGERFRLLVRRQISRNPPDVIHIHYGTTAVELYPLHEVFDLPIVVSFYGFDISQALQYPRISTIYKKIMQHKPIVHVLCDEARERAIKLGCAPECIRDVNLPLNLERYPKIGLTRGKVSRWLIPARFVEKKGHKVLLEAFKEYLLEEPEATLTCWGYGPTEWLETLVDQYELGGRVKVVDNGLCGDFDAAYVKQLKSHDVVLAPSISSSGGDDEGGPALTAVMAQVAAKPVILSDFPGSERSVTDGVEGFIVPQGDVQALVDAMKKMSASPKIAAKMGLAGRDRTIREFSRQAYSEAILDWYQRLIK